MIKQGTVLTLIQVEQFLETKANRYRNAKGVHFKFIDTFSTSVKIWSKERMHMSFCVDFPDADSGLFKKLNFSSVEDLDRIDEALLWEQYVKGQGYVWADPQELLNLPMKKNATAICFDERQKKMRWTYS